MEKNASRAGGLMIVLGPAQERAALPPKAERLAIDC